MIDNEVDFGNILDAPEDTLPAAKLILKPRLKPRKATLQSKSSAPNPAAKIKDGNSGAVTYGNASGELSNSHGGASLTCPVSEIVDDITGSQGTVDTPSIDVLTVPSGPMNKMAQMIDNEVEFGNILDAPEEDQPAAKLSLKPRAKPRKATLQSKSSVPNPAAKIKDGNTGSLTQGNFSEKLSNNNGRASLMYPASERVDDITDSQGTLDVPSEVVLTVPSGPLNNCGVVSSSAAGTVSTIGNVSQDDEHLDDSSKSPTHHESLAVSDIHESPDSSCGKTIDDVVDFGETLNAQAKEETVSKLQSKVQVKLPKIATKSRKTNQKVEDSAINVVIDNERSDTNQIGPKEDHVQALRCHGTASEPSDSEALPDAEPIGKGKSVSFSLPDASEGANIRDTTLVIDDFNSFFDDLYKLPQKTAKKGKGDPSDHAVEQQQKLHAREIGSSMKLRSRNNAQKCGISRHPAEDFFDEDFTSEQDNDSSIDYTAGSKRKIRRKSRDCVEEPQKQGVQNVKSQVSSRGRKKILKDAPTEKTEKKLTHRIRQKRMKEVKTLLETPYEEIDHKKLSAAHLRLLQEARERITVKETPSGPSSNTSTCQHENPDDCDCNRYDEAENLYEDRTETNAQNVTKLNYHSYMNKQTRSRWSKSETDLFYQGLRQFGSDFAMIQQLFPDKTRHHVRQKFKAEEKKNPMLIHDAIIHRSGDNLYFKKVIKQLNIEDAIPDISTHEQDGASNKCGSLNENASNDFIEEENRSNQLDKEEDIHMPDVQEEHVSGNSDDDLGDIFDWY